MGEEGRSFELSDESAGEEDGHGDQLSALRREPSVTFPRGFSSKEDLEIGTPKLGGMMSSGGGTFGDAEDERKGNEEEEEEEEEEADLDIYRRAIKENAKAIPEHQSKIFEISQRIRELKPSQRGEDRKDDDRSAWL